MIRKLGVSADRPSGKKNLSSWEVQRRRKLTWFRFIWYGEYIVKGRQSLAAFVDVEFEDTPLAMDDEMLGSLFVMKLPQIWRNARAKSGLMFGVAGPKSV
jgi:hypothetical protein